MLCGQTLRVRSFPGRSASATHDGQHTARLLSPTRTRTWIARAASPSSRTASSRITASPRHATHVARGHRFTSQTDTEVLPHLIEEALDRGLDPVDAITSILPDMHGALVFLVACAQKPDTLIAVRTGNAGGLVVGLGDGETFAASDLPALVPLTRRAMPLNNGEIAVLRPGGIEVSTLDGEPVTREYLEVTRDPLRAAKGHVQALHAQGDHGAAPGPDRCVAWPCRSGIGPT